MQPGRPALLQQTVLSGLLHIWKQAFPQLYASTLAPIKHLDLSTSRLEQSCSDANASEQEFHLKLPWYAVYMSSQGYLCKVSSSCLSVATQTDL